MAPVPTPAGRCYISKTASGVQAYQVERVLLLRP